MSEIIDTTKIALSRIENRKLRWILRNEPVENSLIDSDPAINRLYQRKLLEQTYSEEYPYTPPPCGVVEIPSNALRLSDAGRQYLNRHIEETSARRVTRIIAIWGAITGTIALLIDLAKLFQQ